MNNYQTDLNSELVDELLESVWTCHERGDASIEACLANSHKDADLKSLETVQGLGLVEIQGDQVSLTEEGTAIASRIIRRHRLAERLMVDALGMTPEESERFACLFEHSVVPEVTDGICTLLGHPKECPHGRPIPSGRDCESRLTEVTCALTPLSEVMVGRTVKVAYLRSSDHDRLHQLLSLGFTPGITLRIHQRTPVLVVQMEQSEFAMDQEVAGDVYVWADCS